MRRSIPTQVPMEPDAPDVRSDVQGLVMLGATLAGLALAVLVAVWFIASIGVPPSGPMVTPAPPGYPPVLHSGP